MMDMAHELRMPARQVGSVVFASPHSGRAYPDEFLRRSVLGPRQIRSSEDAFVDLLFADVPDFGAPLLLAHAPRAYIDLNRSCDELDPALVEGLTRRSQSPRIASGLGVVPRVVAGGRAIINGKITLAEAEARIRACWQPYHAALERLMEDTSRQFGEAILLDCHSMPSEAIAGIRARDGAQPDIVLGDRYGSAARPEIVENIAAILSEAGFYVVRNTPFAGAYISQHYGQPSCNRHVVQIEINRALYMDEASILPSEGFESLRERLRAILPKLVAIGRNEGYLAAE